MWKSPPPLLPMFRSETQVRLLGLLVLQPDRGWTLEGLADLLRAPVSSVHRELGRAIDAGLVQRDDHRRPYEYRAATDARAYAPFRQLLELTVGVPQRLNAALADVPGVVSAAIHGSWAAGRVRPHSDIDVIVVTKGARAPVQRALRGVGREVGREMDASVLSPEDYNELLQSRNPFLARILNGPRVDVIGEFPLAAGT